jgi:uncharacterized protein YciI
MLFAIAAFLRPEGEAELIQYSQDFNEFLGPSAKDILAAGVLRDATGHRVGYLALIERDTIDEAQEWLNGGPLHRSHLAAREQIFEYQVEVGRLG